MQHQQTITHKRLGVQIGGTVTATGTAEINLEAVIASAAADYELSFDIELSDAAALKMLFIMATEDMTIKWNDSGGTQGTNVLKANEPVVWHSNLDISEQPNPLITLGAVDITSLFVTNNSNPAAAGTLYVSALLDPTV